MKVINLAYPERSNVEFEIIKFPDGHQHVKMVVLDNEFVGCELKIISRFSMDNVYLIRQILNICNVEDDSYGVFIPYFPASRCDRNFSCAEDNDFLTLMNMMPFNNVKTLEVHNKGALEKFWEERYDTPKVISHDWFPDLSEYPDATMCYPDQGALKRYNGDISKCIWGVKDRNINTGEIITYYISSAVGWLDINCRTIIVRDDICDGGATFIACAKLLKEMGAGRLILVVAHGIFSKGFDELLKYYDFIHTTNSYQDINHPKVIIEDVFI